MLLSTKDLEFKGYLGDAVQLDIKAVGETGEFEGYGSVFGNKDDGRDVIMPGAFANSLKVRPAASVKMLWQHDPHTPIGKWTEVAEDSKGLLCKGRLFLSVKAGAEAHTLLSEGAVDGLSIGYRTKSSQIDKAAGVRRLTAVDLFEVSVVTFPMNESARVSMVKSAEVEAIATLADAEDILRDAGFSRKEARAFISRVKGIPQCDAGVDQEQQDQEDLLAVMQKLTQSLRG